MKAARLRYAPEARRDLAAIRAYISGQSGRTRAAIVTERIRDRIRDTRNMPETGVARPDFRPDCRFVVEHPYLIYFAFERGEMTVPRILHAARDRDSIMRGVQEEALAFAASA